MAVPFAKIKETALMAKAIQKSGAVSSSLDQLRKYYGGPELNSIALEYLLSSSTLPLGIIIELFGPEGSGKTTVAVSMINDFFMRLGGEGALIDQTQQFFVQF
jgi:RecA/RadA recombinase